MNTPDLPRPMNPAEFYALLALSRGDTYGYALKAIMRNDSLGGVVVGDNKIYRLLERLVDEAWVDEAGSQPAGPSGKPRRHYAITVHGQLRLKEELQRLEHAARIGRAAGLMDDSTPLDIQRLLLEAAR
ncbi:MAG TPA: helix-turn-helix transcriptional regulator [Candidatus Saccharimonadia bacterium]|nr:helix-turn-helix transcriptional regulator [Candidatus Saccharimonadia bacterium]